MNQWLIAKAASIRAIADEIEARAKEEAGGEKEVGLTAAAKETQAVAHETEVTISPKSTKANQSFRC